ncbi:uncharacterized protein YscB-like, partial [Procambarus clarkii]|uniref:uncharacterized protein YscB-like n=1 Tax=Procambarus clarkii TaxID=6728 RepID=UPI0037433203
SLPNESLGVSPYETLYGHKPDLATLKLKLEIAKIEREQKKEALEQQREAAAVRKEEKEREAALRKEEQEREIAILRERERIQLGAKQCHLEMQREHDKQQAAMAMECRQQEFSLETTNLAQRQQATAILPVSFNISHA